MNNQSLPEIEALINRLAVEKRKTNEINSRIAALHRSDLCIHKKLQLKAKSEADGTDILLGLSHNMTERHKAFSEASQHFALLADLCKQSADAIQKLAL